MDYKERQETWVYDNGISPGDRVKFCRLWEANEQGYHFSCHYGKEKRFKGGSVYGSIKSIREDRIIVKFDSDGKEGYYPFFVLELLDKQPDHAKDKPKIKVGDTVRIVKSNHSWMVRKMIEMVGEVHTVCDIFNAGSKEPQIHLRDNDFTWPSDALEVITPTDYAEHDWRDDWPIGAKVRAQSLVNLYKLNGKVGTIIRHGGYFLEVMFDDIGSFSLDPEYLTRVDSWDDLDYAAKLSEVGLEINRKPLTIQPEPEQELRLKPRKKLKLNYTA